MGSRRASRSASTALFLFILTSAVALMTSASWATSKTTQIYSFTGNAGGEYTDTELARDNAGNLYGTSVQGGAFGGGTVFKVTPTGVHAVLYNFTGGADGGEPYKGVTLDADGNLVGTAVTGGGGSCEGGCGVVFKVTNSGGTWTQTVIHTFTGADGSGPGSPVSIDRQGNVYGTTPTGGKFGVGVVYQLTPNGSAWTFHVIHNFSGGTDGAGGSAGRLLIDSAGHLYGACTTGGANGLGTVFKMASVNGKWRLTTLYAFKDQPDGALPYGGLILDTHSNLYGTTYYAGANDFGTVFKISYTNGAWTENVLYSFKGGTDGASPISSLVRDAAGNLYGTTSDGGAASCVCGVIFKLAPGTDGTWTESVAYSFLGTPKPGFAYNGMVPDWKGNFYGATVHGGTTNDGAIYKFTP